MLLYGTGFDWMPTTSGSPGSLPLLGQLGYYGFGFASITVVNSGRFSGKAMSLGGSVIAHGDAQASYLLKNSVTPSTWFQGCAMYVPSVLNRDLLKPFIGVGFSGACQYCVAFAPFGTLELWEGRPAFGGTLVASSSAGVYTTDTWNYIELGGLLVNNTSGHLTVKLNTVTKIAVVSKNTSLFGTTLNSYMYGQLVDPGAGDPGLGTLWDDAYLNDDQGVDNNTYIGNIRVRSQITASAGASTQYTPFPTPPNWQAASNLAVDDSAYVFDNTTGHFDLYNVTPIAASPQVFGVFILGAYRQNDATQRSASNTLKSGATTVDGAQYFTPGNYAFSIDCFERDPNTASPWVYTDVNLIQIGPKTRS